MMIQIPTIITISDQLGPIKINLHNLTIGVRFMNANQTPVLDFCGVFNECS